MSFERHSDRYAEISVTYRGEKDPVEPETLNFLDYPMATLEEKPLHNRVPTGHWYACRFPERPWDSEYTWVDWRCRGCTIAAEAHLKNDGNEFQIWCYKTGSTLVTVTLVWLIGRAKFWAST